MSGAASDQRLQRHMWLWRFRSVNEKDKLEVRYSYESAGGGLLTESRVTCAEEATGWLLRLCLTKHTKPGLLLLLAKRIKPCFSSNVSRSESATESRLCRLCCGLDLAE